jgi:hypothetical protein
MRELTVRTVSSVAEHGTAGDRKWSSTLTLYIILAPIPPYCQLGRQFYYATKSICFGIFPEIHDPSLLTSFLTQTSQIENIPHRECNVQSTAKFGWRRDNIGPTLFATTSILSSVQEQRLQTRSVMSCKTDLAQ